MPFETPVPVPVIPPQATRPALGALPTTTVNRDVASGFTPISVNNTPVPYPVVPNKENAPIMASTAAGKPKPVAASKKRKSTDAALPEEPSVNLDDINVMGMPRTENCDQIRRKITRFLDSGAMTKTGFCKEIGVSMKSLNGFMGEHGPYKGFNYAAYDGAWEFFKKREVAGVKLPVKRAKTATSTVEAVAAPNGSGTTAVPAANAPIDISDVHLEGEETDSVPVYDTCDEIRRKINVHLKKPGVTQAQFGRDVLAQLHVNKPTQIQGTQIARFRNMKGANAGAKSSVFYGAYVFFEKLRIKEGKPKTAHRLDMEKKWPNGFDREHDHRTGYVSFV
ncbi:hypothetical protein V8F20_003133 [Naviculisporaceae sp. PSN 640]